VGAPPPPGGGTEVHVVVAGAGTDGLSTARRLMELGSSARGFGLMAKPLLGWPGDPAGGPAGELVCPGAAEAPLRAAVETARMASGPGAQPAVLCYLWGHGDLGGALQRLAGLAAFREGGCRIRTVTAVLELGAGGAGEGEGEGGRAEPRRAEGAGALDVSPLALSAPHVASLLHPGVLGAVILSASHYADVSRATAAVARRCPRARILRASALSSAAPDLFGAEAGPAEAGAAAAGAAALASALASGPAEVLGGAGGWRYPAGRATSVVALVEGSLDAGALARGLKDALGASRAALSRPLPLEEAPGGEPAWWLHGVRGWWLDGGTGRVMEARGTAEGAGPDLLRVAEAAVSASLDPKAGGAHDEALRGHLARGRAAFVLWGANVGLAAAVGALGGAGVALRGRRAPVTARDAPAEAVAAARARLAAAGPPAGWVFDGFAYRDGFGEARADHPGLAEALEEWAAGRNAEIAAWNDEAREWDEGVVPLRVSLLSG